MQVGGVVYWCVARRWMFMSNFFIKIKFYVYLVDRKKGIRMKFSGFSASIRFVYHIEYTKILLCLICYTVCFNVIPDKNNSLKVF